jgi:hypothetical protein
MNLKNIIALPLIMAFFDLSAQSVGVKLASGASPNTTLDVNGAASFREGPALVLANGVNNDIVITDYSMFRITGPTAAFSITGFGSGADGRVLTIVNATTQNMTVSGSTGSLAANQILTGGMTFVIPVNGSAAFQYNTTLTKWVVTSTTVSNNSWTLTGNTGTSPGTNFIGTTDPQDLVVKTNGTERMRFENAGTGHVGIGTTNPQSAFHVYDTDYTGLRIQKNSATSQGPRMSFYNSRGTEAVPVTNNNLDILARFGVYGHNGTSYVPAATGTGFLVYAAENFTATSNGTFMSFFNVPKGLTNPVARWHMAEDGDFAIGVNGSNGYRFEMYKEVGNLTSAYNSFYNTFYYRPSASSTIVPTPNYTYYRISPTAATTLTPYVMSGNRIQVEAYGTGTVTATEGASGFSSYLVKDSASTINYFAGFHSENTVVSTASTSPGTVTTAAGLYAKTNLNKAGATFTNSIGVDVLTQIGAGTITNNAGLRVRTPSVTGGTFTNNYGIYLENQANATNNYAIYSLGGQSYHAGNFGLGITTPAARLHQDNGTASSTSHKFTAGTTTGQTPTDGFDIGIDAVGNAVIDQNENLDLIVNTNNTERMRVLANGNVGIGTTPTNAVSTLDVMGSFAANITTTASSITLDATHHTVILTGGTPTVTLPLASDSDRRIYWVINNTGSNLTISTYVPFGGGSSTSLSNSTRTYTFQSDGTNWYRIQ